MSDPTVYYRDIVNSLAEAMLVVDGDLVVHFANLSYYALFGGDETTVLGRRAFALNEAIARDEKLFTLLGAVASHDMTLESYEIDESVPILGRRTIDLSARRIKHDGLSTAHTLITMTDVTEEALERAKSSDEIEQRAAQVVEINHRVKNNLASVLAMLRLERRAIRDGEAADILERIALRVQSISSLYELLAVNSREGSIGFRGYVQSICNTVERVSGGREQGWSITVTGEDPQVTVDEAVNLGAVLNELIANAAKYAFIGRAGEDCAIAVDIRQTPGELLITVEDNGSGIDAADNHPKSTGLGMKLVDVYLTALNGRMDRVSERGKGTSCRLHIRREAAHASDGAIVPRFAPLPQAAPAAPQTADVVSLAERR